jgi:guanylate kinase
VRAHVAVENEPNLFDITIVNDTLDTAYAKFIEFIQDDLRHFEKATV